MNRLGLTQLLVVHHFGVHPALPVTGQVPVAGKKLHHLLAAKPQERADAEMGQPP